MPGPHFNAKPVDERWELTKSARICFNCLNSSDHKSGECMSAKCDICQKPHHRVLHRWDPSDDNSNAYSTSSTATISTGNNLPKRAFLPIVQTKVSSTAKKSIKATALLDSASEVSVIIRSASERLGLKSKIVKVLTEGVGGVITEHLSEKAVFTVEDNMGVKFEVEAVVMDKACGNARPIPKATLERIENKFGINTDLLFTEGGKIDILIGMGKPLMHRQLGMHGDDDDDLCVVETRFGPSLVGTSAEHPNGFYECSAVRVISMDDEVDAWRFVEAELAGVKKECPCQAKTDDELRYEQVMKNNWIRTDSGRLMVKLPWKVDLMTLPYNYAQAVQQDISLNRQLKNGIEFENLFLEQLNNMI